MTRRARGKSSRSRKQEMTMKFLFAVALVSLSVLSTGVVRAEAYAPYYDDYPAWARHAFDSQS
jgi:hypothetical protein